MQVLLGLTLDLFDDTLDNPVGALELCRRSPTGRIQNWAATSRAFLGRYEKQPKAITKRAPRGKSNAK